MYSRGLKQKRTKIKSNNCLLKIMAAVFAVAFVVSVISTISASAAANLFKIQNAELSDLSATTEGSIASFDETSVVSNVTFHQLNDSAKYTITLKNTDNKEHVVESISDDNENPYITYEYEQHSGEQIDAGADLVFVVTARYTTAVTDMNARAQGTGVKFFIRFTDTEEEIPITPNTGDAIHFSVILLVISAVGLTVIGIIALKNHKKASRSIVAGIIAVAAIATTATVKAATVEIYSFALNTNYVLKDKIVVTYTDKDGNDQELIVSYNEPANIPDQSKDGYTLTGWEDEQGNPVGLTQPVTDDLKIHPVYRAHSYTIRFDGNGATSGTMADMTNLEYGTSYNLTSNTFERTDYIFKGWNTKADGTGDSFTDAQEIHDLTTEDGATITLFARWEGIATLQAGQDVNAKLKTLANGQNVSYGYVDHKIKDIQEADSLPADFDTEDSNHIISETNSPAKVYAWFDDTDKDNDGVGDGIVYFYSDASSIRMNQVSSCMFYNMISLTSLAILDGFDASNVTNMAWMFEGMTSITSLTLPDSFDTSNVTNMDGMFQGMRSLTSLTLPDSFDTSNVTDMGTMFGDVQSLTSLTLPDSFDTSNVTDMSWMFVNMQSLTSLTLPDSFDTSNVTDMGLMFKGMTSLTSLTLPDSFDTSNVTTMSWMFKDMQSLTSLTLPDSFDTSKVTNMSYMFANMQSLTSLTLPDSFDTSNVTNMGGMFSGMRSFTSIAFLDSLDTSNVTNMSSMFYNMTSITSLTLPDSFDTSKVTDMSLMFCGMQSLTSLTLPDNFDTSNVTDMNSMFGGMQSLTSLTLPDSFDTSKVTDMHWMFKNMASLTSLALPDSFDTAKVTNMWCMFCDMRSLASLTLPDSFVIKNGTTTNVMFSGIPATATLNAANAKVRLLWPGVLGN